MSEAWPPDSRRPLPPDAGGERTRDTILRAAASLATVDGLDGLSIGNLAAALGMSKSRVTRPFRFQDRTPAGDRG